jgi:hypothetical protein
MITSRQTCLNPGRKIPHIFSNQRRYCLLFIICLLAIPSLGLADDDHDWNVSVNFTTIHYSGLSSIMANLSWDPPPKPPYARNLYYRLLYRGAFGNLISWGNTSGSIRIYQGYVGSAQFKAILDQMLSMLHEFTIELNYSALGKDYKMSCDFTWYPPPLEAAEPEPADATVVQLPPDNSLRLYWTLGRRASTHDVYFSDSFQDVNDGTQDAFLGNMDVFPTVGTAESDYPDALIPGKTYYWRIDEVDEDGTKHKGNVWNFWTKPPIEITDPNLVCWWTFDLSEGVHVIDWSGHDHDGTISSEPVWVDGREGRAPRLMHEGDSVVCPLDRTSDWPTGTVAFWIKADALGQDAWSGVFSSYCASSAGFQIDVDGGNPGNYQLDPGALTFGAVSTDWVHLALAFENSSANLYYNGSLVESGALESPRFSQFALGINRNMSNSFSGVFDELQVYDYALTQDEIEQVMRVNPLRAWGPSPADGSVPDIGQATRLVWSPGDGARQHNIYFGSDDNSVADADVSDTSGMYRGRQSLAAYALSDALECGQSYYWRIDEVNDANDAAPSKGNVWSFTVRPEIAYRPYPSDGCRLRQQNVTLSWMPGSAGILHDVYLGTDFKQVNDADNSDTTGVYRGRQDRTNYTPEQLDRGREYSWRIDEVEADSTTIRKGNVWTFTIINFETLQYQISSSQDDGYATNENLLNLDGAYLKAGYVFYSQPPYYAVGMIFRNVEIPPKVEVVGAHLKMRSYNSQLSTTVFAAIQAEATDSAADFGAFRNIGTLNRTNASVDWDLEEPWTEDTWYTSPDISSIIQEIINRAGWSEGNSMAIIYGARNDEGGYRNISSFDRGIDYASMLEITYIP